LVNQCQQRDVSIYGAVVLLNVGNKVTEKRHRNQLQVIN